MASGPGGQAERLLVSVAGQVAQNSPSQTSGSPIAPRGRG